MVLPDVVIDSIISRLDTAAQSWAVTPTFIKGSEDTSPASTPPLALVYEDFDEEDEASLGSVAPLEIPCSIYITFVSAEHSSASDAMTEVLTMAFKALRLVVGEEFWLTNTDGQNETVMVRSKLQPLAIIQKSAESTAVTLQLTYNIYGI